MILQHSLAPIVTAVLFGLAGCAGGESPPDPAQDREISLILGMNPGLTEEELRRDLAKQAEEEGIPVDELTTRVAEDARAAAEN